MLLGRVGVRFFSGAGAHAPPRLLRSVLFVPGSNLKAIEKAKTLRAVDGLIFDLEDAVALASKADARKNVLAAVTGGGYEGRTVVVRVNAIGTEFYEEDVAAVASVADKIHAVLLPKVESGGDIDALAEALPPTLPIWANVETPRGILAVHHIAKKAQSTALACLVAGTSDLTKDLRARHVRGRQPLLTSLQLLVLAARANGLAALDGVNLNVNEKTGELEEECRQGRDMGFDGKTAIHPSQVTAINDAFSPSTWDVDHARRVVAAHAEATAAGSGVVVVDGRLIENLHVAEAHRIFALAAAIEQKQAAPAAAAADSAAPPAQPAATASAAGTESAAPAAAAAAQMA